MQNVPQFDGSHTVVWHYKHIYIFTSYITLIILFFNLMILIYCYCYCYRQIWCGWVGWWMWHVWGRGGMFTGFWWANLKKRYCLKNLAWIFNILLTVHHAMILGNYPTWSTNSFQCIYLFIVLYMFRAWHAHHQEKQVVSIQLLVIVTPCLWHTTLPPTRSDNYQNLCW